jgi:CBS domain containing-hemolysin-like protein
MAIALACVALLALLVRALAAGGASAVAAALPGSPRAASLEGAAMTAAALAAAAAALAALEVAGPLAAVVVLAVAPLTVLAADLLPRALVRDAFTGASGGSRRVLAVAGAPLAALERGVARVSGAHPDATAARAVVPMPHASDAGGNGDGGNGEGELSSGEVIRRIFDFRDTRVREVMVPLIHIYAVRHDATAAEAFGLVAREKVSRMPVFQVRMYNIIGVVHALDLLDVPLGTPVTTIMRPPLYVPENKLAHQQLRQMQRSGVNMAVVVDEHGGAVGIVTVEDLLEEIVGEIEDEYDEGAVLYEQMADGRVRCDGAMEIARLNELFPWRLPEGEYETIAGLVVTHLGRIPRAGARLKLPQVALEVSRADRRAVREVIVRPADQG